MRRGIPLLPLAILAACDASTSGAPEGPNDAPAVAPPGDAAAPPADGAGGADGGSEASAPPPDSAPVAVDCTKTKCLYVTETGAGTKDGSDWANALAKLPAKLVRGATYFLAGGSYGDHTFDDAPSGTTPITIKRALATAHGTDAGWVPSYAEGQAAFTGWLVTSDHWVFDGGRRNADWRTGGLDQYGIKTGNTRLDDGNGKGGNDLTFRGVDFHGGGRDTGEGDDVIYGLTGNSQITFQACALHDSDRTIFLMRGNWKSLTIDHCYIARNTSSPAIHGELMSFTESDGVVISNNAIEDIEGSSVFAAVNGGLSQHWKIFGNTFVHTADYVSGTGRDPDHNYGVGGFVLCAVGGSNNATCNDFLTYNNTFVNVQGLWSGTVIQAGSGNVTENNVWYKSARTNNSGVTTGYNWYFDTPIDGDDTATKVVCTSGCDIFVDRANRDFHLATATAAGQTLPAPFTVDPDGVTRGAGGWDRGAFERQ